MNIAKMTLIHIPEKSKRYSNKKDTILIIQGRKYIKTSEGIYNPRIYRKLRGMITSAIEFAEYLEEEPKRIEAILQND
jgi:hypothetical protein